MLLNDYEGYTAEQATEIRAAYAQGSRGSILISDEMILSRRAARCRDVYSERQAVPRVLRRPDRIRVEREPHDGAAAGSATRATLEAQAQSGSDPVHTIRNLEVRF